MLGHIACYEPLDHDDSVYSITFYTKISMVFMYVFLIIIYVNTMMQTTWLHCVPRVNQFLIVWLIYMLLLLRWGHRNLKHHIYGLVQDYNNSVANALELLQSCTKPSICITYIEYAAGTLVQARTGNNDQELKLIVW